MGLGVALSGFLTGFAKQATAELETRNKELRDNIDRQIEEHKKKVQLSIEEKREQRKEMQLRHGNLAGIFDTLGKDFSYGQMAYVISSDQRAKQFENLTKQFNLSTADGRQEIINRVQLGKNSPKFGSLEDAIELSTQVEKVAEPVIVDTRTAFGLPSNIQSRRLAAAKKAAPELYEQPKESVQLRGSIMPKFTPDTATIREKTVFDQIVASVNKKLPLSKIPGVKERYIKTPEVGDKMIGSIFSRANKSRVATTEEQKVAFKEAGLAAVKEYMNINEQDLLTNSQMQGINSALQTVGLDPIAFKQNAETIPKAGVVEAIENIRIDPIDTKKSAAIDFENDASKKGKGSKFDKSKKEPIVTPPPTAKKEEVLDVLQQISTTPANTKTRNILMDRLRRLGFNDTNAAMAFLKQQ